MALASAVAPILQILSIGSLLNGFMHIPYMLQLAHEWSGLAARTNGLAALVVVPALIWTAPRYGPVGAAFIWVCFNAFALLVSIHVMHRRILPGEKWRWYRGAVMVPLLLTAITAAILKLAQPAGVLSRIEGLVWIVSAGFLVSLATVLSLPECRQLLLDILRRAVRRGVADEEGRPN
jgi:O-antigen/teichoic acid export membrane protein